MTDPLLSPRQARRRSFRAWMAKQVERDDPIGDLARDALRSGVWISKRDLMLTMRQAAACVEALAALDAAGAEFSAAEAEHLKAARAEWAAKPDFVPQVRQITPREQFAERNTWCPFCGCPFAGLFHDTKNGDVDLETGEYGDPSAAVKCTRCGAVGPYRSGATVSAAKAAATDAWVHRVRLGRSS